MTSHFNSEDLRDRLAAEIAGQLWCAYDCMRVWSAWGVGTMSENDFRPTSERAHEIADAIIPLILASRAPAEDLAERTHEPVAWRYESENRFPRYSETNNPNFYARGWTETPLYGPDLLAAYEEMRRENNLLKRAIKNDHIGYKAIFDAAIAERDRLAEALTPSAETKAAYIGEFSFPIEVSDEDGDPVTISVTVPWTTTKEIMAAIRCRAALQSAAPASGEHEAFARSTDPKPEDWPS